MARLRRASPHEPGIRRRRRGPGFSYVAPTGEPVRDAEVLERIRRLAVPPAWTDVWICPFEEGHLQAVGTDAAGRRQYKYHERWQQHRQRQKYDHMLQFAAALPSLRARVAEDLSRPRPDKPRVLAAGVRLLDLGFFRIGSEAYAEQNGSYGLATIKRRDVIVRDDTVQFNYVAKGGKRRIQQVRDAEIAALVRTLKARRGGGDDLLAAKEKGVWRDVRSGDVNDYLRQLSDVDFTAKDFRTWHATVLAAVALARMEPSRTKTGKRRAVSRAVCQVSESLGNTPAVCRTSYIDPRVIDRFWDGWTIEAVLRGGGDHGEAGEGVPDDAAPREAIEAAVVDLVEERDTSVLSQAA
jgi:DNA topoisomerase IB